MTEGKKMTALFTKKIQVVVPRAIGTPNQITALPFDEVVLAVEELKKQLLTRTVPDHAEECECCRADIGYYEEVFLLNGSIACLDCFMTTNIDEVFGVEDKQ